MSTSLTCSICLSKDAVQENGICHTCASKLRVLKPASRYKVDKAAEQSEILAEMAGKKGEALLSYIEQGDGAGRKW